MIVNCFNHILSLSTQKITAANQAHTPSVMSATVSGAKFNGPCRVKKSVQSFSNLTSCRSTFNSCETNTIKRRYIKTIQKTNSFGSNEDFDIVFRMRYRMLLMKR